MKVLKGFLLVFTRIIAVALCVGIFGIEIALHVVINTKGYLNKENIEKIVDEIDPKVLFEDEKGNKTDLAKDLYKNADKAGIPEEAVDKLIESKSLRELAGKYIGSVVDTALYDTEIVKPNVEDLVKLVEDNYYIIEDIAKKEGKTLTEKDKTDLLSEVRKNGQEVIEKIPDIKAEINKADEQILFDVLREVYAPITIIALILAIVILTALIALLTFHLSHWMIWLSVPTMISSVFMIIIGLCSGIASTIIKSTDLDIAIVNFISDSIIGNLFTRFLISGIIGFVISIALIVVHKILNKEKDDFE